MENEEVLDEAVDQQDKQDKAADKGKGDETVTLSKAEVESLRRERDEARESERYWSGVARGGRAQEPADEPAEEIDTDEIVDDKALDGIDGDTPEKLVDDLAAKGVAGLKARGFITAADAQKLAVDVAAKVAAQLIGRERQKFSTDAEIMTEFPELKNKDSELFKETAKRYQKAVAMDPNAKKTPAALYLAADAARESLKGRKGARDEAEEDRRARSDSQDGRTRGRREIEDDDSDMNGPEALQLQRAFGVTADEMKAQRGGAPAGRRR